LRTARSSVHSLAGKSGGRILRWRRPCVPWPDLSVHRRARALLERGLGGAFLRRGGATTAIRGGASTAIGGASTAIGGGASTAIGGASTAIGGGASTAIGGASTAIGGVSSTAIGGASPAIGGTRGALHGFDSGVPWPGFPYCGTTVMVVPDPRARGGHHRPRAGPGAVVTICSELVDITAEDSILSRQLCQ
jgi:hypothetical protein